MKKSKSLIPLETQVERLSEAELKKIEDFAKNPTILGLVETATGAFGTSKPELIMAGGRIIQAFFKGKTKRQIFIEINELRKKGKIDEEHIESEYSRKSFADIMELIDTENPDPKKLEAIKKLFYFSISTGVHDKERMKAYYLLQTTLKLQTFDIEVISFCYRKYQDSTNNSMDLISASEWVNIVSTGVGYDLPFFVEESERRLSDLGIISGRTHSDRSGILRGRTYRLTPLGISMCEVILKDLVTQNI